MGLNCCLCRLAFRPRQHKLKCTRCSDLHHRTCHPKIRPQEIKIKALSWECPSCISKSTEVNAFNPSLLPFFNENLDVEDPDVEDHDFSILPSQETQASPVNLNTDSSIGQPAFQRGLLFGQLNINSLVGKIDELRQFLVFNKFAICGITETKLSSSYDSKLFTIKGYNSLRFDRKSRMGGGSMFYIHESLRYLPLDYDVAFPNEVEINCVQIFPDYTKSIICILVYNPPVETNKLQFLQSLETLLYWVERDNAEYVVMGDFNIDLLSKSTAAKMCRSIELSFGLKQIIDMPTRVSLSTQTILDHIYVSFNDKIVQSGVFSLTNSDHRFTYFVRGKVKLKSSSTIIEFRSYKNVNWEQCTTDFKEFDWSCLKNVTDTESQVELFEKTILIKIDDICPVKRKRVKVSSAPWMNNEVLELIKSRNCAKNNFDLTKDAKLKAVYNKLRNRTALAVCQAKRRYFLSNFENIDDSGHIWNTFFKLTGRDVKQSLCLPVLKKDNLSIIDDESKSKILYDAFFMTDSDSISDRDAFLSTLITDNENTNNSEQSDVSEGELISANKRMKWKNSQTDQVPAKVLKNIFPSIIVPLTIIFSNILATGNFPNNFKKAYVLPLFKGKGSVTDPSNYRPICLLSNLSKLFEYVINSRIMSKVEESGLLDDNQHGFRRGRSCTTALTVFSQEVFKDLDKPNNLVLVVYFDLKKAFDSLKHIVLLITLRDVFKIQASLVLVIANFLIDRTVFIKLGSFISSAFKVNRGIGQGSVNGPHLFILFFNDVGKILFDCSYSIFADDLAVYISDSNVEKALARIKSIIERLDNWCKGRGLLISYEKTKWMLISKASNKNKNLDEIVLECNGNVIERVQNFKYLGITVDENFNFKPHFELVVKKVCSNIGMIHKNRRLITPHVLKLLINSHINSITDYCITVWGPSRIKDFNIIQNKINDLLAIFFYPNIRKFYSKRFWKASADCLASARRECKKAIGSINYYDLLEKCNQFTITERLKFFSLWNVYKVIKFGSNICQIKNIFSLADRSNRITRNSNNLEVVRHKSCTFENSPKYYSTKLWNSLPSNIKQINDSNLNVRKELNEWILFARLDEFV